MQKSEPIQSNDGGATLFNFFSRGGKPPLPIKPKQSKKKPPIKPVHLRPPKTRKNTVGRPAAKKKNQEKVLALRKLAQKKAAGAMATPPQKRRRWNGSVSCLDI